MLGDENKFFLDDMDDSIELDLSSYVRYQNPDWAITHVIIGIVELMST